jgi:class 3 adenylate cyclase
VQIREACQEIAVLFLLIEYTYMDEIKQLKQAIASLETQRSLLDDESFVDAALAAMREKLATLQERSVAADERQQRKQVTVLFADVSNFTAMAEMMDPEEVSGVIDDLWSRLDKAILEQGGRIDKHIGDAVMALFGAPIAHEDDPERAIRAALELQSQIKKWKQEFRATTSDEAGTIAQKIEMRVGINTGLSGWQDRHNTRIHSDWRYGHPCKPG